MKNALPIVLVACALSAVIAFVIAIAARPGAAPAETTVSVEPAAGAVDSTGEPVDVTDLRMQIARLESRIDALESAGGAASRISVVPPGTAASDAGLFAENMASLDPDGERAFRDQVSKVLEEIDEEKREEERAREMQERAEEASRSYEEYDEVDLNMDEAVAKLGGSLGLDSRRTRDIESLLATQNERNREMTRMWASGEVSDEELGVIFMENRAKHRSEVIALVGAANLPRYKRFVQQGGLGGRFSYFTAPWESWAENDPAGR